MSKRERVEDLGRIAEKSYELTRAELWDICGAEDIKQILNNEDAIEDFASKLDYIHEVLIDIYDIARWGDNIKECGCED